MLFLFFFFFSIIILMMKKLLIKFIDIYQITPLHSHSACRFIPTCSEYTKICINNFGVIRGTFLGLKRILRCHPFGKSGIDMAPVKEK